MATDKRDKGRALTSREAAERLGVSIATLPAWRSRGRGPRYCHAGRSVRYLEADLAAFLERGAVDPEGR
jgi:excisionase family DNA binding protein